LSLVDWVSPINWWWVLGGFLLFVSPPGRMGIAVFGARVLIGDPQRRPRRPVIGPRVLGLTGLHCRRALPVLAVLHLADDPGSR
ncbi:hypothetical protein C6A85_16260, partial [Mycobacterium sp. ITM-2017-0098]